MKKQLIVLGLVCGLVVPVFAGQKKKEKEHKDGGQASQTTQVIDLSSAPAAVQSTIAAHLAGGTVSKVESETKKGVVRYEAEIKTPDGKEMDLTIAADGTLLKTKMENPDAKGDRKK